MSSGGGSGLLLSSLSIFPLHPQQRETLPNMNATQNGVSTSFCCNWLGWLPVDTNCGKEECDDTSGDAWINGGGELPATYKIPALFMFPASWVNTSEVDTMRFYWLWTAYAHGWGELPYECCKEKSKELCPCKEDVSKQLDITPLDSKPSCWHLLCHSTSHSSAFWIKFLICMDCFLLIPLRGAFFPTVLGFPPFWQSSKIWWMCCGLMKR